MTTKFVSERNLRFLLYDVLEAESLVQYPAFQEHSRETFDIIIDTALKMSRDLLQPCLREMDQNPPRLVDGQVKVHPAVKAFMTESGDGGWIGVNAPFELGGQQLPATVTNACQFAFAAANYSASVYPLLTAGAAHLILSFGSQELIDAFVQIGRAHV